MELDEVSGDTPSFRASLRLFVVDDHAMVLAGLISLLTSEPDLRVVGYASGGQSAIRKIAALQEPYDLGVDMVITDVEMLQGDGVRTTHEVNLCWPNIRVIALSMHEDRAHLQQLLRAGVSGYVLKRSAASTLVQAVRAVAGGRKYIDPEFPLTSLYRPAVPPRPPKRVPMQAEDIPLSAREEEVMRLMAWGYSNCEIAAKCLCSIKTIESHKVRAQRKMNIDGRVELMRYALDKGWLNDLHDGAA